MSMDDVQKLTDALLIAGRSLQQKSSKFEELVKMARLNVDALEAAADELFSGLDEEVRIAVFGLNDITLETHAGKRRTDKVEDLMSDYFFGGQEDDAECLEKIRAELILLKKDGHQGSGCV